MSHYRDTPTSDGQRSHPRDEHPQSPVPARTRYPQGWGFTSLRGRLRSHEGQNRRGPGNPAGATHAVQRGNGSMSAIPVGNSVLGTGPSGTVLRPASGRRESPTPARYRDIAFGAARIRVQRTAGFIAGTRTRPASTETGDAVPSHARSAADWSLSAWPPRAIPAERRPGLITTTPVERRTRRPGPKKHGTTMVSAGVGAAQDADPNCRFTPDNYCYRA